MNMTGESHAPAALSVGKDTLGMQWIRGVMGSRAVWML